MKKTTILRIALVVFLLLFGVLSFGQLATPFTTRLPGGNIKVKGDVILIGNSIITGKGLSSPYNGNGNNNAYEGEYIDVDTDASTFSSSSAQLAINNSCKKIAYAGLYWASIYPNEVGTSSSDYFVGTPRLTDWNVVKFKLPTGGYIDLTANKADPKEVIYDGYNYTNINSSFKDSPIICYKDVTSLLAGLTEADGTYTLANLRATRGKRIGGCAAGWTLVVIYESPTMPSKFISIFDGYAGVQGSNELAIPISGFQTLPSPLPVHAKIGVSALEGDLGLGGDTFQFKAATKTTYTKISDAVSLVSNFFNSTNSNGGVQITTGNPSSKNLLGYDIKNVVIKNTPDPITNAINSVIPNNETAGDFKLTTSGDGYGAFVTTFAVEIIEPKILLTKEVQDASGADASNADVTLSQELNYVIGFENQGNDDATGFTIKDVLPINTTFNYPTDIDAATLPTGVTHTYDAATRTIIFTIPDALVKANLTPGPPFVHYSIKLKVKVVDSCNELSDACENMIKNSAYATYKGVTNTTPITDDPSLSSFTSCNLGTPQSTNFLVGVKDCLFTQNAVLCGASSVLTASKGYGSYNWTGPYGFTATGQIVTVTQPGVYTVSGVGIKPCTDYTEEITVATFGGTAINPVIPFADNTVDMKVCPNNGVFLPKIFLCGATDSRAITTGITGAISIVWEKTTCNSSALPSDCANDSATCVWTSAGANGKDFTASDAGQYRVTINYEGGCFNRYYFNVYKNELKPTVTKTDIYCNTLGTITVGGVPAGYEYSLDGVTYQPSNVFSVTTAGTYTVSIRQTGVASNPCVFTVEKISIYKNLLTVTLNATPPACFGDKATILAVANNVRPQYQFDLYKKGTTTLVNSSGLITSSNQFLFENVNPGDYDIKVTTTTTSGVIECTKTESITIIEPSKLSATSAQTKALTCEAGEITVTASGGTSPYYYSVNGSDYETDNVIPVTVAGTYIISVADAKNCITTTTTTVTAIAKPAYIITKTDIKCYGDVSGEIKFNVTNANGYTLKYSINNGVTYQTDPVFSNKAAGTYQAVLKYSVTETNGTVTSCLDTAQIIVLGSPSTALTASGGVAKLAGCGALGEGTLRITNAQGGTPNYEYSFDGGATYQTTNAKEVMPGTYTLVIKDSQGCTFSMPSVILDPKPADPTITVDTPSFNCDGSGTTTATVTNPGGVNYSYEYYIDTVANSPITNNVFTKVPSGPHTVSVKYKVISVPTYSNLLFEDFGVGGNTTTPGIASAYCFHDLSISPSTCTNKASTLEDNQYAVTKAIIPNNGAWFAFRDHTTNGTNPNARFLAINIGSAAGANGVLYSKTINNIIPNQPIIVEAYLANLFRANFVGGYDPSFAFELIDSSGTIIAQQPPIPPTPNPTSIPAIPPILRSNTWELRTVSLNPGNHTSLIFRVRSGSVQYSGNDGAIDDIKVFQVPESCATTKDFIFTVPSNKAFTASVTGHKNVSCSDATDGTITIAAQNFDTTTGFYYAVDGATTYSTSTTSPLTITGLSAGAHTVKVQYDLTSSPCLFPLSRTVTAPTAVTLTASITKQANCSVGATITAVGSGGTPALQYELRLLDGTVVSGFNFSTSAVFTNVPTGNYMVYVRDANLCGASTTAVAVDVSAPTPPVASLDASSDLCYDATNKATLVVTATGTGTLTYSLDGQAAKNTNIFSNVGPGTHSIVVTDSNNCTATISDIVIAAEIKPVVITSKTLDCTASPNATIDISLSDGTAPYTYKVKLDSGSYGSSVNVTGNTFSYSAASQGTYTFEITDAKGCVKTTSATVDAISKPTATATPTDPTCHDATDGQVQIVGAGGSGSYTYSFNGGAFSATSLYTGLNANTTTASTTKYTYQVKDSKDCTSPTYTITLTNPTEVVASATISPNTTCSTTTLITASGAGGSGTYTYSFNGSTTYTATKTLTVNNTSAAQPITYSVKNTKGCTSTKTISIPAFNSPTGITFSTPAAITCKTGFTTTSITLTPIAGVAPFAYVITAPAASITNVTGATSGIFTGLSAGTYTFKVTDANGCIASASKTIAAAATIAVAGVKTDEKCSGNTDGTATFTITGASSSGNYTYAITPATVPTSQISKSGNVVTVTDLGAGTYTLTVTDVTTGCTSNTASVIVSAATAINFTLAATKTSCNNALSTISFPTLSGGTPGYTYAYAASPSTGPSTVYGSSTTVDTAVLTKTIDVWIKDNNGCTAKKTITVGTETAPTITTPAAQCYTGTAISVTITGTATGTTTYSKDGISYQSNPTFNLNPGSYTLSIKDGFGCVASTPYVVASQLTVSAIAAVDATCTPNTTINLTAAGGTGAYTYEVSSDGGTTYATAANPFVTPTAGTYIFRVTDSGTACKALSSNVVVTTKATILTLTTSHTDVKCKGDATGTITITPTSGKAPYTYSVTKGGSPIATTAITTGLVAGTYDIAITDALGCTSAATTVTILEPTNALSATADYTPTTTCSTTATITVTATGGTATYTYSFKGGAFTASNTYVVNDNGTDQVINYQVKDANGCITASQDITVLKLNPPTDLTFTPSGSITCTATTTTITLGSTGGSGTLQYETITPSPIIVAPQTSNAFANLTPGTYLFKVTDANGCTYTESYTITPVTPITITGQTISNVLCTGYSTGIAKYTVTGFSATGNYAVVVSSVPAALPFTQTASGDVITLSNLAVGTYNVKVTDITTGCTANTDVTITEPTNALAATFTKVNANCKTATAKVTVTTTAGTGTPGYTYAYMQDGVAPGASNYVASNVGNLDPTKNLNWDVWVKDANGCTVTLDVTIAKDPTPTVTASVTNQCAASGSTFQIVAVGDDGVAPYTYTINTGVAPTGPLLDTFTVAKGTYTITVKDANGCTNTTSVTVNDVLTATAALTKDLDCTTTPDATITVTTNGGKAPYTYEVSSDAGVTYTTVATNVYTATAAGTYQFKVTDDNGCTKVTNSVIVAPIVYPVISSLTPTNIQCHGDNTGVIVVAIDATKGVGPFTYSTDGTNYQSSNTFTGLVAGSYTVTVKDSKGCTITGSTSISEPAAIDFDLTEVSISCNNPGGSILGSITVSNVTGGTASTLAPFTYYITNNFGDLISGNPYTASTTGREDHTFTIINFGVYTINIIDGNGCSKSKQITMASPPSDLTIDVTTLASDCTNGGTAIVKAISTIGSGTYLFGILEYNSGKYTGTWYGPDVAGGDTKTYTNLVPGVTYTFVVHDTTTDCYFVKSADQPISAASTLTSVVTPKNITCIGANDGKVSFTIANFDSTTTSVDYQIFKAYSNVALGSAVNLPVTTGTPETVNDFSPLAGTLVPGQYYIHFIENGTGSFNGCKSASAIFEIKESSVQLSVTASVIKNENCNDLGIINAVAKDGTAPYSFMISTLATLPLATDPAWAATTSFSEVAGSYYVYVKDAYGCIQSSTVVVLAKDPEPVIALAVVDQCAAEGDFAVTVTLPTAGMAPYTITVNGGAAQNITTWPYTVSNLNSGLQTILVKDVNGCSSTQTVTLHKKLSVEAALTKELDCTTSPDATITLSVADGLFTAADSTTDFTYEVSTDNGVTYGAIVPFAVDTRTAMYTATTAGTYQFRITDLNSCTVESTVVTVDPKVDPTATATFTNPSCPTDSDGTLTITATLGVPPYEYTKDGGTTWQTDNTFTGLPAGVVNYTVRDSKQCIFTGSETLVDPITLAATATITDYACNASNIPQPAIVTVNVTAGTGTGPYKYNFDGSTTYLDSNTYVVGDLLGQTVHYYVKDFNGCLFDNTITVNAYKPITDITFVGTAPTCPTPTSDVTLTVVGGYTPIAKYEIVSPTAFDNGTSNVFLTLAPDTYLFKVTDANGCSFEKSYTVKAVTPIAIVGALVNDISCNPVNGNTDNGSAQYTVTGFSATGNYNVVVTPATPYTKVNDVITLAGLSAGTYNVEVTDITTGCLQDADVTITLPTAITFTAAASKVFCSKTDSEITISAAAGGTGVFTYAYVKTGVTPVASDYSNSTSGTVNTLTNGLSYDVYVKDDKGCEAKQTVTVVQDAVPTISVPSQQCYTGSPLTVDLSTLTTTYNSVKTYTLDGSALASSIATFNAAGTYSLGIKDDNGCEAFVNYTIEKQLLATASITKELYCAAPINATIKVDIEGGKPSYTYQMYLNTLAVGSSTPVVGTTFTASVATAGDYTFKITDANAVSCSFTTTAVTVATPATATFTETHTDVSCNGGNNGSITITPANGIAPYTFALTGTGANNTGDSTGLYTGLVAGSYTVVVTDAYGCTSLAAAAIVITQPAILTATTAPFAIKTSCDIDTKVQVVAAGGTTPYYYNFGTGFDSVDSITVNDTGADQTINYTVKDGNGCTVSGSVIVYKLNAPTSAGITGTTIYCAPVGNTTSTVTVDVTPSTGVGSLAYTIVSGPMTNTTGATTGIFTGLTPGDYTFQVTDANGCLYQELYTVKDLVSIAVSGQTIADMSCHTGDNGQVSFDVSGFSADYTYSITKDGTAFGTTVSNSTLATISLTNLGFGVYAIMVTDNTTSCIATALATVLQPTQVTLAQGTTVNANCKTAAQVQVIASGGTPDYTYSFVKAGDPAGTYTTSDSALLDPAISTTWHVYVKDANGCTAVAPLNIAITTDPLPAGFTANVVSQCPSATGTYDFDVTVGTGMAPYEYSIGNGFQTNTKFTVDAPGTYDLTVKDTFGCTTTFPAAVTILEPIALKTTIAALPSCYNNDGSITASATGGSGNYSFQLDGGTAVVGTMATFSTVSTGSHTIVVTDTTTNCTDTETLNLIAATPVTGMVATKTDVTCNGGTNGTIDVTLDANAPGVNDDLIYTYTLVGTTTVGSLTVNVGPQPVSTFTGLSAGTYTVTVTSGRGCVDSKMVTIVEPAIITVPTPVVDQFGCTTGTNSTNYATITAGTVIGGSGVYTYEFVKDGISVQKGSDDSYTESILTGGSFIINVTDDKGCTGSTSTPAVINPFISLDKVNVSVTTPITCSNNETITLTVDTTGGTPAVGDLSYTVNGYTGTTYNGNNTTGIFSNLVVGQYLIEVTNTVTGCSIQSVHYVNEPNTFVLKASNIVDLKCFADTDGSADITLVDTVISATDLDQAGPFTYTVTDAAGTTIIPSTTSTGVTANITGLKSGIYTVNATLTNSPYCSVSTNFSITGPTAALSIAETHTEITCEAADSGSISVAATGGWTGDYEFELVGPVNVAYGTQTYFENLTAGSYTVNVKDSSGCVASTAAIVLVDPTPITIIATANPTLLTCYGDKTATVTASGVTGGQGANYLYTLNTTNAAGELTSSGPQSDPIFSGLGIGSYTITVTDGWGCSMISTPVVITEPAVVVASLVVASTQTCTVDSELTLSATGGTGPYNYYADATFTTLLGTFASSVNFPVAVGTYHYYVKDANGCSAAVSNDIKIDPLPTLLIDVDNTNAVINCKGDATGVIVATAVGGIGNYTFTLLDGAGAPVTPAPLQTTPGNFTQLAAGSYQVQVTSGVDCGPATTAVIDITEPTVGLTAFATPTDVTCNGAGNGIITVTASGGTGIIKYAITPYLNQFFETNSFINLKTGSYDLIAQDENGCYVYMTGITIGEPSPLKATLIVGSIVPEVCSGDSDGEFSIAITGGTADYKVSLDKQSGPFTTGTAGQTDFNFQNVTGGSHIVYVADAMGCNYELPVVLPDPVTLNPIAIVAYDCLNNLPSNTVTVKVDSSVVLADVDYALDGLGSYQTSNVFSNVSAGPHFVSVRHSNGCIKPTQSFTMLQVNPLAVVLGDGGLNEIVATTTGGSGIYHYTFNGESTGTNNTYIYYQSGDYTVEVIDGEGCTATDTKPFVFIDINIPNVFTPNGDGNNDLWGPTNTTNYPDIVYNIYDRYGRVVGTYHKDQFWDGKYNGLELPSGDYWYTLKLNNDKDAREFVGHFTLYR